MEDRFIITQSEDVINYANVLAIYTDTDIEETENGDEEYYLLLADSAFEITFVLGVFESEEQSEKEKRKLISWLKSGKIAPKYFTVGETDTEKADNGREREVER